MKLSTVFSKLTQGRAKMLSTLGGLAIVGATLTAAAPAANAQVSFGVSVGPRYYAPAPRPVVVGPAYGYGYRPYVYGNGYAPGYWEHRRYEDWRAQQWRDRRAWDYGRGYGRPYAYGYGR